MSDKNAAEAGRIEHQRLGDVAVIVISDSPTLNALSPPLAAELLACLETATRHARAILLTGAGKAFCSGAKLTGTADLSRHDYDAGEALDSHFNPLVTALRNSPVPVVTAVNGAAAGIGCSLALMGDLVVASDTAYFLQAFRRIGLVPDGGTAWLLTHTIGRQRAMEMMMLGERIDAARALEWGLVSRVVPAVRLFEEALAIATDLANGPSKALGMIRRQCWEAAEASFVQTLATERRQQCEAGRTADHREGVAAFLGKRIARFVGR